jgi:ubiquinone/menaquinone biosynthesis C-methylase UbiE
MNFNPAAAIMEMLHNIAAHPWVYDRIQTLAGQRRVLDRMSKRTAAISAETVVDVGGGTGASRKLWPVSSRYICLDIEMPKLAGFRSNVPDGLAILSDATKMPIVTGSVDVLMCMAVVHHLTDAMLEQVFEEALRVLKVGGHLILLDPVLNPTPWRRCSGSLIAVLSTPEDSHKKLEGRFKIIHWESSPSIMSTSLASAIPMSAFFTPDVSTVPQLQGDWLCAND